MVAAEEQRKKAAGPTSMSVAQGYTAHQITSHDLVNVNAHRQELHQRPDVSESIRHYVQPDVPPAGSSLGQPPDVQALLGIPRAPLVPADQPARTVDHQVGSMRCETCSRPAMFVCSACRKAPYCSVECQVCFRLLSLFLRYY